MSATPDSKRIGGTRFASFTVFACAPTTGCCTIRSPASVSSRVGSCAHFAKGSSLHRCRSTDAPGFDWNGYFGAARLGEVPRLIVRQNTAMPQIAAIYAETPIETLRAWQAFHTTDQAAPRLSNRFADAQWAFRLRDLQGQPEQRPRDKRAIGFAEGALGEALGRQYVER